MGIFDGIFNNDPQKDAANAQISGLTAGFNAASGQINTGLQNSGAAYAEALAPIAANTAVTQKGQDAYADATGVNGKAGYDKAVDNFHTGPGYNFALDQGSQNVLRNQSQTGALASGGTMTALDTFGQGLANQQWQSYLSSLQPFIGASTANAATGAGVGIAKAGTATSQADTLANLAWSKETGIGNANANADLSQISTNGNIINAGMQGLKFATSLAGFL